MALSGNFMFPTCQAAGLRVRALLHNSVRPGEKLAREVRERGLEVDLSVYANGARLFHAPSFGKVALDGALPIDATTCPVLAEPGDKLIVAKCSTTDDGKGYLVQEHQLAYESDRARTNLLYDQLPTAAPGKKPSPIVLLAPKAWVSTDVTTLVAFPSYGPPDVDPAQKQELEVTLLGEDGKILSREREQIPVTGVHFVDVRARIGNVSNPSTRPRFVNVVARGGAAPFAILTFIVNQRTGGVALEHSLSPHYYVRELRDRLRSEALLFPST